MIYYAVISDQHENTKYFCELCKKYLRLPHKSSMKKHQREVHQRIRKYACDICDKKFSRSAHLQIHSSVHDREQGHECEICTKKFYLEDYLKNHIKKAHTS